MSDINRETVQVRFQGLQAVHSRAALIAFKSIMRLTIRPLWKDTYLPVSWQRGLTEAVLGLPLPQRQVSIARVSLGGIRTEEIRPRQARDAGVVFFVHGGAFLYCSPLTHRPMTAYLARLLGQRVVVPDYRLAPEHVFPAGLNDVLAAWQGLLDEGVPAECITLMGDSAGGGLALTLVQSLRDRGIPMPRRMVLFSPWVDLTQAGDTMISQDGRDPMLTRAGICRAAELYRGLTAADHPQVSPLFGSLAGLPPTLVQVGTDEVLLSDSERLAVRAAEAGWNLRLQVWEGMFHDFQAVADFLPAGAKAMDVVAAFARG